MRVLNHYLSLHTSYFCLEFFFLAITFSMLYFLWDMSLACMQHRINYGLYFVACPAMKRIPHVLVVHGESGAAVEHIKVLCSLFYFYLCILFFFPHWFESCGRKPSPQIGFCTSLPFLFHMEHTIPRLCFLFIRKGCGLLFTPQTWSLLIGTTKHKVYGCKTSPGKIKTPAQDPLLKMILSIISAC